MLRDVLCVVTLSNSRELKRSGTGAIGPGRCSEKRGWARPPSDSADSDASDWSLAGLGVVAVLVAASLLLYGFRRARRSHTNQYRESRFGKHTARPDASAAIRDKMVMHETGYNADTLEVLWQEYKDDLPQRKRKQELTEGYFYLCFVYIHLYPTSEQCPRVLWSPQFGAERGLTKDAFTKYIEPMIYALSLGMRSHGQVRWAARLRYDNHTAFLPSVVTGAIDTASYGNWPH